MYAMRNRESYAKAISMTPISRWNGSNRTGTSSKDASMSPCCLQSVRFLNGNFGLATFKKSKASTVLSLFEDQREESGGSKVCGKCDSQEGFECLVSVRELEWHAHVHNWNAWKKRRPQACSACCQSAKQFGQRVCGALFNWWAQVSWRKSVCIQGFSCSCIW